MAQTNGVNFNDMSRDELVDMVGGDVDPDMSRDELIALARASYTQDEQL